MPKHPSQKNIKLLKFLDLLASNVDFLTAFEAEPTSSTTWKFIKATAVEAKLQQPPKQLDAFLRIVNQNASKLQSERLLLAVNNYRYMTKAAANSNRLKKRELVAALGLGKEPLSYVDLAAQGKLTVIVCDRFPDKHFKCGTTLVDCGNEDLVHDGNTLSVPADDTWHVVKEHESIAFTNSAGQLELVVIRGSCILRPDLIDHVNEIIMGAVNNRRGVRPNHGGKLIQYGWNAGPRHARIFGLVRNVANKKLNGEELDAQDKSILGIMSLTWNFLTAVLPKEIINPIREKIAEAGLPPIASPGNIEEHGYELCLPGGTLSWNTAERAPAEAYMSQDYFAPIHTDQLYAPYALNWVTMHDVIDPIATALNIETKGAKFHRTAGGNYVDVSLRVVVKCAKDTAMTMKPTFKHGTTLARPGVKRHGTAINFSTHIRTAFDNAVKANGLAVDVGNDAK